MYKLVSAYRYLPVAQGGFGIDTRTFLTTFQKVCEERIPSDLEVRIKSLSLDTTQRCVVELEGANPDDERFVANILKELIGEVIPLENLKRGMILRGFCRQVGAVGFGLFVDVGITSPDKEVLLPLFNLRQQLVNDQKLSLAEIIRKYGFMDNFPVDIEITRFSSPHLSPDQPLKIEGQLAPAMLDRYRTWIEAGNEILFASGLSRQSLKKVVAKRGHSMDLLEVQRLGPLESALVCKEGTYAPGLISRIGPFLENCKLSPLIPAQVRRFWKSSPTPKK
jgi:hypothetical protein